MRPFRYSFVFASIIFLSFFMTLTDSFCQEPLSETILKPSHESSIRSISYENGEMAGEEATSPANFSDTEQEPIDGPLPEAKIVIRKLERKLYLYSGGKLLREYPIKLGKNPVDDKIRQGDLCTPEGNFYICIKNPRSQYHLSLGLSYPNIEDARRGLQTNLINKKQYDSIVRRNAAKGIPPWNTPLGGEIFIHGEAEIWEWTYGCVALYNEDIEELFTVVPVGTQVVIQK